MIRRWAKALRHHAGKQKIRFGAVVMINHGDTENTEKEHGGRRQSESKNETKAEIRNEQDFHHGDTKGTEKAAYSGGDMDCVQLWAERVHGVAVPIDRQTDAAFGFGGVGLRAHRG